MHKSLTKRWQSSEKFHEKTRERGLSPPAPAGCPARKSDYSERLYILFDFSRTVKVSRHRRFLSLFFKGGLLRVGLEEIYDIDAPPLRPLWGACY